MSISDELASEAEALARATGKTKSEVVRDALRRHVQHERFVDLRRYGRGRAEARGVGPEDVEELVDEPPASAWPRRRDRRPDRLFVGFRRRIGSIA